MKHRKYKFVPAKPDFFFECKYGVFQVRQHKAGGTSICYTTSKDGARLVSVALNRFLNSDEGRKWLEDN